MSVLSETKILARIYSRDLQIAPLQVEHIQASSIDLTLGDEIQIPKNNLNVSPPYPSIDDMQGYFTKSKLDDGFMLKPGNFILGQIKETIDLSNKLVGNIQNRNSLIRMGIDVGLSTYINPGYKGRLPIAIHNIGEFNFQLVPGMRICQLILQESQGVVHGYGQRQHSKYHAEENITLSKLSEDVEFKEYVNKFGASPDSKRIKKIADFLSQRMTEKSKVFLEQLTAEQKAQLGLA